MSNEVLHGSAEAADAFARAEDAKARRAARKAARAAIPPPERDHAYDHLGLDQLRELRARLGDEETKVAYWRRIVAGRLEAVRAGATDREPVADLTLPCLGDGPDVRLAGLRGAPTVINLWASWCTPCRDELPLFADLAATGKVRVVGISVQDDPGASLSLLTDVDVHYASVMDYDGVTKAALRWVGLPMTLFVSEDGVVTHVERGQITTAEQLDSLVAQTLGVEVTT